MMDNSLAQAASGPHFAGQIRFWPAATAAIAAGSTPDTGSIPPCSDNSPRTSMFATASDGTLPIATNSPNAIGRSKCAPSLTTSAGARLTAMRFGGRASPIEPSAARTRSRDSATALSASPTMAMAGNPLAIWTCTSTGMVSIPRNATVVTAACMICLPYPNGQRHDVTKAGALQVC